MASLYLEQIKYAVKYISEVIHIPPKASVLDIGSGNNPFARADVLCERSYSDDTERVGKLVVDRSLVVGDVTQLPFLDNSFDIIVCSHLLEHLENPEEGLKEIMRVGHSGIIEVPSEYFEKINSHAFHYWFITYDNNILRFKRKSRPIFDEFLTEFFREQIWLKDRDFMKFYNSNRYKYFNIRFKWQGKINYSIERFNESEFLERHDFKKAKIKLPNEFYPRDDSDYKFVKNGKYFELFPELKITTKKIIRKYFMNPVDIYKIIACPKCKTKLNRITEQNKLICDKCKVEYPIVNNIPILLLDNARPVQP